MSDGIAEANALRVVLVTGPSGAGRSTAIKALEDAGYEAIDNLPISLLPRLLDGPPTMRPLALGVDVRNRDFSTVALIETIERLAATDRVALEVLYLDCAPDILVRRFSETRRRHPMAPGESPVAGVAREIDLLAPIRVRADVLLDTSELSPNDLRGEVGRWFAPKGAGELAISVQSFSYKRGLPRGIDMVLDCRFLRNPYWEPELRGANGTDPAVSEYVKQDSLFQPFFEKTSDLISLLLPAYKDEGKAHFAIAFGCTGGQHRSVTLAESLGVTLAEAGWQVSIRHRELERRAADPSGAAIK